MMYGLYDNIGRKPPRDPQIIAADLLSLRLDKPEPDGREVPFTYDRELRLEMMIIARTDDILETVRRYQTMHIGERIEGFLTALTKVRDGLPLETTDRAAIGDGLEINNALIQSRHYSQDSEKANIHPESGSDVDREHKVLFQQARDLRPDLWTSRSEYDDHLSSIASWGYYLDKVTKTALTEKAVPLIAELARSLHISLRSTQRE